MCRHPVRDGKGLSASILEDLPMLMGWGILSCYMLLYFQSRHIVVLSIHLLKENGFLLTYKTCNSL